MQEKAEGYNNTRQYLLATAGSRYSQKYCYRSIIRDLLKSAKPAEESKKKPQKITNNKMMAPQKEPVLRHSDLLPP